jgi:hypothetical protein
MRSAPSGRASSFEAPPVESFKPVRSSYRLSIRMETSESDYVGPRPDYATSRELSKTHQVCRGSKKTRRV